MAPNFQGKGGVTVGIYISGMFIATEYREYKERSTLALMIAVVGDERTSMYRVYMDDRYTPDDFVAYKPGDDLRVKARPYVTKDGTLAWADGELD